MRPRQRILFILAVTAFIISCNQPTVIRHETDPIDASLDPVQQWIDEDQSFSLERGRDRFIIKPVARYSISARVVSARSYSRGWESSLSPVDLALAWGELSTKKYDRYITYRQRNRWYYYKYSAEFPLPQQYIINHSCNSHMIPASNNIQRALKTISNDDFISIQGYLVNVNGTVRNRQVWWSTSTTRSDSGDHSCEIIYVEKLRVNHKVYL